MCKVFKYICLYITVMCLQQATNFQFAVPEAPALHHRLIEAPLFRPDYEERTSDEEYVRDVLKMMGESE